MSNNIRYQMRISLNILNHLGLNLYSNTSAVLSEVIANAWDADATEVNVEIDVRNKCISVSDNGIGMDVNDINDKFLHIGYQKRKEQTVTPLLNREPMGRKGIGKLSLFAIANKIEVHTRKENGEKEALLLDAEEIRKQILSENKGYETKPYLPTKVQFDESCPDRGTKIKIDDLTKLNLDGRTITGLKRRIARRFSIIGQEHNFIVKINGESITFEDRDYFNKARFLFNYGPNDYSKYCKKLDIEGDPPEKLSFQRPFAFDQNGKKDEDGLYKIYGWIAIARHSNDLDSNIDDENLNKITIIVRGKIAQEDVLGEYRLGGMFTKYVYGEINADFLDEDDKDDIATSSRQKISEDDQRYKALKTFIGNELREIWPKTDSLKERKGIEEASDNNPYVKEWYENLETSFKASAKKIFGAIAESGIDYRYRNDFYANGILTFEMLKMNEAVSLLDAVDEENVELFLEYLNQISSIEKVRYGEIVAERISVIEKFRNIVDNNAYEKILEKFLFDNLWLLDPAWERATQYEHMEETLQAVVDGIPSDDTTVRLDIRYRTGSGYVLIELKRASVSLSKSEIEGQLRKYKDALEHKLLNYTDDREEKIESICLVGKLPRGWSNKDTKNDDIISLQAYSIRVLTYDQLVKNALWVYSKFAENVKPVGVLQDLIEKIRSYEDNSD